MATRKVDILEEGLEGEVRQWKSGLSSLKEKFSSMEGRFASLEGRCENLEEMLKRLLELKTNSPNSTVREICPNPNPNSPMGEEGEGIRKEEEEGCQREGGGTLDVGVLGEGDHMGTKGDDIADGDGGPSHVQGGGGGDMERGGGMHGGPGSLRRSGGLHGRGPPWYNGGGIGGTSQEKWMAGGNGEGGDGPFQGIWGGDGSYGMNNEESIIVVFDPGVATHSPSFNLEDKIDVWEGSIDRSRSLLSQS